MVLSAASKKNLILAMILPYTYGNIRDEQPVTGTTVWPDISAVAVFLLDEESHALFTVIRSPCRFTPLLEGLNTLHYFGYNVTSSPKWNFLGVQIIPLSAHDFIYHIVVQNSFSSESSNTSVSSIISLLILISFVISYFCLV